MKPKIRLELSDRDLKILQYVFEQRAVAHFQIERKFFANFHRSVCHERMSKLVKFGLLQKAVTHTDKGWILYYGSTEKGLKYVVTNSSRDITDPDFKSDSVNHDIGLVDVRERLSKSKLLAEYLSESVLQSCKSLRESEDFRSFVNINSDAALVINGKNSRYTVALEYEISDKAESRYSKKILEYHLASRVEVVLYVCRNAKIENLIRKVDSDISANYKEKVFTCLEENFHNSTTELAFSNRSNAIYRLI